MKLSELARECANEVLEARGDCEIAVPFINSREKTENGLFFCISGAKFDAHAFAPQAVENGARALVVERFLPLDTPQLRVRNVREAIGRVKPAGIDVSGGVESAPGIKDGKLIQLIAERIHS